MHDCKRFWLISFMVAATGLMMPALAAAWVADLERGKAAAEQTDFVAARDHFERALDGMPNEAGQRTLIMVDLATAEIELGNFVQAERYLREANRLAAASADIVEEANALQALGRLYLLKSEFQLAQDVCQRALDMTAASSGARPRVLALDCLGLVSESWGPKDDPKTLEYYEQAWRESEASRALSTLERNRIRNRSPLRMAGKHEKSVDAAFARASATIRASLDECTATYGRESRCAAESLLALAMLYFWQKQMPDAGLELSRALAIGRAKAGESHYLVGDVLRHRALIELFAGQASHARNSVEAALAIALDHFGEEHEKIAILLKQRAMLGLIGTATRDQVVAAVADFDRAIPICKAIYGPDHRFTQEAIKAKADAETWVALMDAKAAESSNSSR
jgi:tetratricopeptide (TPR) repeat protein